MVNSPFRCSPLLHVERKLRCSKWERFWASSNLRLRFRVLNVPKRFSANEFGEDVLRENCKMIFRDDILRWCSEMIFRENVPGWYPQMIFGQNSLRPRTLSSLTNYSPSWAHFDPHACPAPHNSSFRVSLHHFSSFSRMFIFLSLTIADVAIPKFSSNEIPHLAGHYPIAFSVWI